MKDAISHSYHVQRVQELTQKDYPHRMDIARWFLQQNAVNPDFLKAVLFTDESIFTHEGTFNTHNQHVWVDVKPHATHSHAHQRRFSINVWAGIIGNQLLGHYLLPERVDGEIYHTYLKQVLPDILNAVFDTSGE